MPCVLVYGGNGALGRAVVTAFVQKQFVLFNGREEISRDFHDVVLARFGGGFFSERRGFGECAFKRPRRVGSTTDEGNSCDHMTCDTRSSPLRLGRFLERKSSRRWFVWPVDGPVGMR
jgi:NAD(P)-dependent dehydrogenase (short-subunit alcohol dehydrogenase family)